MLITTPGFITAKFFMRDEPPDMADVMPAPVHGKNILVVDADTPPEFFMPSRPKADGVLLTVPGISASLRFADCAPVLLWRDSWVMLLHSGYKGTVMNISREGLKLVAENLREVHAWIGPCIGREYFRKIGDEWTQKGIDTFHRENFDVDGENVYFDLAGEIRSQLLDAGLSEGNIALSGIDTLKDDRCYSYRRGDVHERMTLFVSMRP